jgi:hypothetical protein
VVLDTPTNTDLIFSTRFVLDSPVSRRQHAEVKYPELEPRRRKEILEQMESILAESELESDVQKGGS